MEPTERNRRAWEQAHRRRGRQQAPPGLPELVRTWLPDLRGRHVLHFPAERGEATAELVALGGLVTALDPSEEAVAAARARVPAAAVVHADPQSPPPELLRGRFQLVFAGEGSLDAIADLTAGFRALASALRPGAFLLVYDTHPVARHVDPLLHWRGAYFREPRTLGDVVTAVAQAELTIRRLEEVGAPLGNPHVPGRFALVARR